MWAVVPISQGSASLGPTSAALPEQHDAEGFVVGGTLLGELEVARLENDERQLHAGEQHYRLKREEPEEAQIRVLCHGVSLQRFVHSATVRAWIGLFQVGGVYAYGG